MSTEFHTPIEGTLKTWNDERGFGFIEPLHGGQEIFAHIKAFSTRSVRPTVGQRVRFAVEMTGDGKKRAKHVELVRSARPARSTRADTPAQWGTASLFAIPAFLIVYALVGVIWKPPAWVAGLYAGASLLCFVVYWVDKSAAAADRWRVREDHLLMLGLVGGWPGAIIAQQVLRHKSNKASFRTKFWVTVVLNILGFIILSTPLRAMLT